MGTTTNTQPTYANFREAFCSRYNIPQASYARRVFYASLHRRALLPVLLSGGMKATRFHKDLEAIHSLGNCTTSRQLQQVLNEFDSDNRIDNGFLRTTLRCRVSGRRLAALFQELAPLIRKPAEEAIPAATLATAAASAGGSATTATARAETATATGNGPSTATGESSRSRQAEGSEVNRVLIKKLRHIHELVTAGRSADIAARECGLNVNQVRRAVLDLAPDDPEFAWLLGYLEESDEAMALREMPKGPAVLAAAPSSGMAA